MTPKAEIPPANMARFNRVLSAYLAKTEKDPSEVLNTKMHYIAIGASRYTPKADRAQIERELGVIGYKVSRSRKTGQYKRRAAIIGDQKGGKRIHKIINARLARSGKPGLYGKDMQSAERRLLAKRFRSVGTLKAGWLDAIRSFGNAVGLFAAKEVNTRVKGRSKSQLAKPGWNPKARLQYNVNNFDQEHKASIDPRVTGGLSRAFRDETRSMIAYLRKKMQKTADKMINGK